MKHFVWGMFQVISHRVNSLAHPFGALNDGISRCQDDSTHAADAREASCRVGRLTRSHRQTFKACELAPKQRNSKSNAT